jgi:hypothetical protein
MKTRYEIIAALLVVVAACAHLLSAGYADWHRGPDSFYVVLLFVLFVRRQKPDDERVRDLKLKALTVGFATGYAATFGWKLHRHWQGSVGSLSAFDFMFVALATALALFHFWRWQDGRAGSEPEAGR